MTYNGSANWETHNICEKFANDLYETVVERVGNVYDRSEIDEQWAKDFVEEHWSYFNPDVDVDRDDLRLVVWSEIAEYLRAEYDDNYE